MTKQSSANPILVPAAAGAVEHRPLTGELIRSQIGETIEALAGAFYEPQTRRVADNGRSYPIDATLPEGVEDTGSEVVVNRFQFIQTQVVDTVCWKLETMLESAQKRVADETAAIKSMVAALQRGRGDLAMVERKADFLDTLEEQVEMLRVAYEAATLARFDQLGDEYETRAQRAERQAAEAAAKPGLSDRLARFR